MQKISLALLSLLALMASTLSTPAAATILFQSNDDFSVQPDTHGTNAPNGYDIGELFSLGQQSTIKSVKFTVGNQYNWPEPVSISIYSVAGSSVGSLVYSYQPTSYAFDFHTPFQTDVVYANLSSGGASLAAGNYAIFFDDLQSLIIPLYYKLGENDMIQAYSTNGSVANQPFSVFNINLAVSLSDNLSAVPLPSALPMFAAAISGVAAIGAFRRRRNVNTAE